MKPYVIVKTLFSALFTAYCSEVYAQQKLHIGVEIGPKQEHFTYEDPTLLLYPKEYHHTIKGINVSYELNKNYTIETGFYSNPQTANVNTVIAPMFYGWSRPDRMVQIPVRISRSLVTISPKLSLRGQIGIAYLYNSRANCPTEDCYVSSKIISSEIDNNGVPKLPYFEAHVYATNRHAWLGEGGVNLNYKLKPKLSLSFTASYYQGLKPITRIYAAWYEDNSENAEPTRTAMSYSKGSSTNYLLRLSYQLFDFSKPKDQPDEYYKN